MTPFPYRAEDVHLTLRPTHQTREPVDDEYVEMMKDDLTATIPESDYGIGLAVPTNSGRLFVDWAKGPAMFYPFDKAVDELTIVDRFGPNTGKPYGQEVEA